jgi:hypothetical protein
MTPRIDEMRAQIHATPLPSPAARSRWQGQWLIGLLSGGALTFAVSVGVAVLLSVNSSAPPAYAATVHVSGGQRTVQITLREEQDIPQLNARLEAEGTRIRVVPVVRGCNAPVHEVSNGKVIPGPAKTLLAGAQYLNGHPIHVVSMTIEVNTIAGRTLVIPDSHNGLYSGGGGVIVGPAPECVGIGPRFTV